MDQLKELEKEIQGYMSEAERREITLGKVEALLAKLG